MSRADLYTLADRMERELKPEQYDQRRVAAPDECGCAWNWGEFWNIHPLLPSAMNLFYEISEDESDYLFGSEPDRDTSLAGTIAAIREVAGRALGKGGAS